MENIGGGGGGGTNAIGGRRPAGGNPGGACGCRGRMTPLRTRPGPFVNHLFHACGYIHGTWDDGKVCGCACRSWAVGTANARPRSYAPPGELNWKNDIEVNGCRLVVSIRDVYGQGGMARVCVRTPPIMVLPPRDNKSFLPTSGHPLEFYRSNSPLAVQAESVIVSSATI